MDVWKFVRDAGKAIGIGRKKDAAPDASALSAEVKELGLPGDDLQISVDGDRVRLEGRAPTQEEKEKIIVAVGNLEGVAEVEEAIVADSGAAEPVFHTVASGDTLWAIAEKTLGSGAKYMSIFEANKPMLSNPDRIYPGQVLRIPQG
ncbi:MAG: peptidoglycan-binding protein LysM [Pseudomonadota bacterium]